MFRMKAPSSDLPISSTSSFPRRPSSLPSDPVSRPTSNPHFRSSTSAVNGKQLQDWPDNLAFDGTMDIGMDFAIASGVPSLSLGSKGVMGSPEMIWAAGENGMIATSVRGGHGRMEGGINAGHMDDTVEDMDEQMYVDPPRRSTRVPAVESGDSFGSSHMDVSPSNSDIIDGLSGRVSDERDKGGGSGDGNNSMAEIVSSTGPIKGKVIPPSEDGEWFWAGRAQGNERKREEHREKQSRQKQARKEVLNWRKNLDRRQGTTPVSRSSSGGSSEDTSPAARAADILPQKIDASSAAKEKGFLSEPELLQKSEEWIDGYEACRREYRHKLKKLKNTLRRHSAYPSLAYVNFSATVSLLDSGSADTPSVNNSSSGSGEALSLSSILNDDTTSGSGSAGDLRLKQGSSASTSPEPAQMLDGKNAILPLKAEDEPKEIRGRPVSHPSLPHGQLDEKPHRPGTKPLQRKPDTNVVEQKEQQQDGQFNEAFRRRSSTLPDLSVSSRSSLSAAGSGSGSGSNPSSRLSYSSVWGSAGLSSTEGSDSLVVRTPVEEVLLRHFADVDGPDIKKGYGEGGAEIVDVVAERDNAGSFGGDYEPPGMGSILGTSVKRLKQLGPNSPPVQGAATFDGLKISTDAATTKPPNAHVTFNLDPRQNPANTPTTPRASVPSSAISPTSRGNVLSTSPVLAGSLFGRPPNNRTRSQEKIEKHKALQSQRLFHPDLNIRRDYAD